MAFPIANNNSSPPVVNPYNNLNQNPNTAVGDGNSTGRTDSYVRSTGVVCPTDPSDNLVCNLAGMLGDLDNDFTKFEVEIKAALLKDVKEREALATKKNAQILVILTALGETATQQEQAGTAALASLVGDENALGPIGQLLLKEKTTNTGTKEFEFIAENRAIYQELYNIASKIKPNDVSLPDKNDTNPESVKAVFKVLSDQAEQFHQTRSTIIEKVSLDIPGAGTMGFRDILKSVIGLKGDKRETIVSALELADPLHPDNIAKNPAFNLISPAQVKYFFSNKDGGPNGGQILISEIIKDNKRELEAFINGENYEDKEDKKGLKGNNLEARQTDLLEQARKEAEKMNMIFSDPAMNKNATAEQLEQQASSSPAGSEKGDAVFEREDYKEASKNFALIAVKLSLLGVSQDLISKIVSGLESEQKTVGSAKIQKVGAAQILGIGPSGNDLLSPAEIEQYKKVKEIADQIKEIEDEFQAKAPNNLSTFMKEKFSGVMEKYLPKAVADPILSRPVAIQFRTTLSIAGNFLARRTVAATKDDDNFKDIQIETLYASAFSSFNDIYKNTEELLVSQAKQGEGVVKNAIGLIDKNPIGNA